MKAPTVTIIDYGLGNLLSVQRGFEYFNAKVTITSDPKVILASQRVVLPGVGAFPQGMKSLNDLGLVPTIKELALRGTPILAICLGMQLLMDEGDEFEITTGLGLIPGRAVAIPKRSKKGNLQKVPHIGWNSLIPTHRESSWESTLLEDNVSGDFMYFVHSYMAVPNMEENRLADTFYIDQRIPSVVSRENITGCQFHPEKSGIQGLKILRSFISK
jgi:glutamine amidotransferase